MKIPQAFLRAGVRKETPSSIIRGFTTSSEPAFDAESNTPSQLDLGWLPFAAQTYHISPNIEDYIIKPMPLCPSDMPNRNGIAFPLQELVRYQPPPVARQVYKAWAGCPVHEEHDNEDCTKAVGVILDASLRPITGFGNGKHWMVHGLVAVDKNKYPSLAQAVLDGSINTGSMGAMADSFTCAVCGSAAKEEQHLNCSHISSTKNVNWRLVDHLGSKQIAYLNAHSLSPIEYSIVKDPAWVPCLSDVTLQW